MKQLKSLALAAFTAIAVVGAAMSPGHNAAQASERFITVASTTSTDNSGLLAHLIPQFRAKTGIDVRVVAVGTGKAIRIAKNGDADVLLVHHRKSEDAFVAEGYGVKRFDVMYNDFVIVGPKADPAGAKKAAGVADVLSQISSKQAAFASRGDDSGTHKKELELWKLASVDPKSASGTWYRETGSGMGATLNTASGLSAYAMTDRGTWISFKNKGDLEIVFQGEPPLHNPYGAILVNPDRHPHVKAKDGQAFIDWLVGPEGQREIAAFKIKGQQAFFPSANGS